MFDDDVDDDDDDDDNNRTKKNDDGVDKTNELFPMETTRQQQQQQQDHKAVPCKSIGEGVYAYADWDFKILERNSDKALYKFCDLADVSYAIETTPIPIVSMRTCSRIDNDDDDDDDDDEYILAPTSIVPFFSDEMIPVIYFLYRKKENCLFFRMVPIVF